MGASGPATPEVVPRLLAEYGEMTRATLGHFLRNHEPKRYLYDLAADYPSRRGKMMRSSLCIATARAFGARLDEVIATAAAIELFHNALLIHDDIQDGSEIRRGRPALHQLCGIPLAINAGDSLGLTSLSPLLENRRTLGDRIALELLRETEYMARESAEGQAMELGWRHDNHLAIDTGDYLTMILKKTCWLATIYPCRTGAIIAGGGAVSADAFCRFGFFLGAAFQIQDDLLNLLADERYGKERDGDLWEGKRTLILIHLLRASSTTERERIAGIFARQREDKMPDDIGWIRRKIDACGAIESVRNVAMALAGAALREFNAVFGHLPPSRDKDFIEGMAHWVFERV